MGFGDMMDNLQELENKKERQGAPVIHGAIGIILENAET